MSEQNQNIEQIEGITRKFWVMNKLKLFGKYLTRKSTGLDIIHFREIRDSIINYYEEEVKGAKVQNDFNSKGFNYSTLEPYLEEHFIFTTQDSTLTDVDYIPLNYKELINESKYSSLLIQRFLYNSQTLSSLQDLTSKAKNIINEIESKIDK